MRYAKAFARCRKRKLKNEKMNYRAIIFAGFCAITIIANAQTESLTDYKNQIKFSPIRAVNILNPGLELSYEREYGKFSTQISATYLVDCFGTTYSKDYSGYRIMLEQKWFQSKQKNQRTYFSLDLGYYSASMTNSAYFTPKGIEWTDNYEDIFNLKRTGVMVSGKFGVQLLIKRFIIDFGIGFGIITHNITHSNKTNPDDELLSPRSPNVYYMMEKEG